MCVPHARGDEPFTLDADLEGLGRREAEVEIRAAELRNYVALAFALKRALLK